MHYISKLKTVLLVLALSILTGANTQELRDSTKLKKAQIIYQQAEAIYGSDLDSATVLLYNAAVAFKEANDDVEYVKCLNLVTGAYYYKGDMDLFQQYAELALKESESKLETNDTQYGFALTNLSAFYQSIGDYETTIELLKKSLKINTDNKASGLELALIYNNIGLTMKNKGDYSEALTYLTKSVAFCQDTFQQNPAPEIAQTLNGARHNLASTYFKNNQIELALDHYKSNVKAIRAAPNFSSELNQRDIIASLQEIAQIYLIKNDYDQAYAQIKEAIDFQKGDHLFRRSHSFELLADIHIATGKYEEAILQYEKANAIENKYNPNVNLPALARRHNGIAKAKASLGQFDEALLQYQKALQALSPGFTAKDPSENPKASSFYSKQDVLTVLQGKGQALWKKYEQEKNPTLLVQSLAAYECGIQVIREIRDGVVTNEAKNILTEKTIPLYEGAIRVKLEQYQNTKDEQKLLEAFALAESNKSQLLLESINEQTALGVKGIPDRLLKQDKELKLKIAYFQKKLIDAAQKTDEKTSSQVEKWNANLFDLRQEQEALSDHFEKNYSRFYQLKYQPERSAIADWQKILGQHQQALIEYFVGEENSYVFLLLENNCKVFQLENSTAVFDAIQTLRSSISQLPADDQVVQNYRDFSTSAFFLFQQILEPALQQIPQGIKSLKIISDGEFNYIPFELLLTEKAPADEPYFSAEHLHYLLSRYQVSYDYSATWMYKTHQNKNRTFAKDFIAYAPAFKKASHSTRSAACTQDELYFLECSEAEVTDISKLLGGEVRLGDSALKTTFEQEVHNYRIIHMATHACADEANPLFNKIFLTDDYLSNADLYNTSLNAELVVLSACNTGSGKIVKGEGVLSLARGFVQAGCASSIVSRWSVDDCATSKIMGYFYEGLKAGQEKDEALRQAKLKYLEGADKLGAHPFYWGAFVGYGDMAEMELNEWNWWWWLLGLGVVGLLFFITTNISGSTQHRSHKPEN